MKILLTTAAAFLITSMGLAQPNLTLWIAPDGYHGDHDHFASQQYFCDGSYYIYYHPDADTLFVNAKNEGTAPLMLSSASAAGMLGAQFEVVDFSQQSLQPGEMYAIKVRYQLPSTYKNGINGQLTLQSNDATNSTCTLNFDVGCFVDWNFRANDLSGVPASCKTPLVYVQYQDSIVNANLLFDDSLTFYSTDEVAGTSFAIMQMKPDGIILRSQVEAPDFFAAGANSIDVASSLIVSPFGVEINKPIDITDKMTLDKLLNAKGGISCKIELSVDGATNLKGNLSVLEDAEIGGTLAVAAMTTPSDQRLKKDIDPLVRAVDQMMMLRPKTYFLKEDEASAMRQYGFIAQELEEVIPSVVNSNSDGVKSVNYLQIIPWLTAALQEQQETISRLEARLAALEGN